MGTEACRARLMPITSAMLCYVMCQKTGNFCVALLRQFEVTTDITYNSGCYGRKRSASFPISLFRRYNGITDTTLVLVSICMGDHHVESVDR